MTDAWRRRDETPYAVAPHGHGKDNIQAAIAFSFFSIITWVSSASGTIVQSIVSLTSSLRGQLVKCFTML